MNDRAIRLTVRDPDPRALPADRRLPPDPGDPALPLAGGLVLARARWSRSRTGSRPLISGHAVADAAPVPGRLRALRRAPVAYLTLAADPYPGFTGRPGAIRSTSRSTRPAAPEPLGHRLSPVPRAPGDPAGGLADGLRHQLGGRRQHRGSGGVAAPPRSSAGSPASRAAACRRGLRDLPPTGSATRRRSTATCSSHRPLSEQRPGDYESANVYRATRSGCTVDDDLRRSRLTVFFRLLLAIPHFVWLLLWGIVAFFAAIANWFATLVPRHARRRRCTASSPPTCATRSTSSRSSSSSPTRSRASPGRRAAIRSTSRSSRPSARTAGSPAFRLFLAIPGVPDRRARSAARLPGGVLSWFYALVRGRGAARAAQPRRLSSCATSRRRTGYVYLLTDRYPYSGPRRAGR